MPSELTFRAQLVLNEQRQIYDYWCRQAGWNIMPRCDDLNVNKIANLAQSLSLLKIHQNLQQSRFYSSGTRAGEAYGFGIKNMTLGDFDWGDQTHYWNTVYSKVVSERRPRQGVAREAVAGRRGFVLFWLRLPLSDDGVNVTDILCHDVPYPVIQPRSAYIPGFHEEQAVAF